ncbi:MAG: succinylglutamate desuccinylase/aspartoacylase family protein [Saprospiraceae bacterium]
MIYLTRQYFNLCKIQFLILLSLQAMGSRHFLGRYVGQEKGPLLVAIGAMHGNEPAGVKGIELMLKMLEVEPITHPDFVFKGRFLGLLGNPTAYQRRMRFVDVDMNRHWDPVRIRQQVQQPELSRLVEDKAILSLLRLLHEEIRHDQPTEVVLLDLHTTSSTGGIFTIAGNEPDSQELAVELPAPVILGLADQLQGTLLQYFKSVRLDVPIRTISFEAGHHTDPLSVNRCIAALTCCMRAIGCVRPHDVESQHMRILLDQADGLPKLTRLVYRHSIQPEDRFVMEPNYSNFRPVRKGELLAYDSQGAVVSPYDGRILLPLYQKQGDDGFFIVQDVQL